MAIFVLPVPVENNIVMLSKYKEPLLENTTFSYIEAVRIMCYCQQSLDRQSHNVNCKVCFIPLVPNIGD